MPSSSTLLNFLPNFSLIIVIHTYNLFNFTHINTYVLHIHIMLYIYTHRDTQYMLSYVKWVGPLATFSIHIGVSNGAVISVFGFSKKTILKGTCKPGKLPILTLVNSKHSHFWCQHFFKLNLRMCFALYCFYAIRVQLYRWRLNTYFQLSLTEDKQIK